VATESRAAKQARAKQILDLLARAYPEAKIALEFRTPFELLVATILSAQCTDERVNMVTPALFRKYPTAREHADPREGDPVDRILSRQGALAARHVEGARRAPRRRGARDAGGPRRAAGRRAEDRQRDHRQRLRRSGPGRGHARVPRLAAARPGALGRSQRDPRPARRAAASRVAHAGDAPAHHARPAHVPGAEAGVPRLPGAHVVPLAAQGGRPRGPRARPSRVSTGRMSSDEELLALQRALYE